MEEREEDKDEEEEGGGNKKAKRRGEEPNPMLLVVIRHRDRLKERCAELEEDLAKARAEAEGAKREEARLKEDNVSLVERMRYVTAAAAIGGGGGGGGGGGSGIGSSHGAMSAYYGGGMTSSRDSNNTNNFTTTTNNNNNYNNNSSKFGDPKATSMTHLIHLPDASTATAKSNVAMTTMASSSSSLFPRGDVERGLEAERRYGKLYDDIHLNPFREFQSKQEERFRQMMSFPDKVMYRIGKLVFGSKEIRLFVFFYLAALHLLVFANLSRMTHHSAANQIDADAHVGLFHAGPPKGLGGLK